MDLFSCRAGLRLTSGEEVAATVGVLAAEEIDAGSGGGKEEDGALGTGFGGAA
jgi:hypothetical protein